MHVWNGLLKVTNIVMETSWPSPVQMSPGTCTTLEDFQKKSLRIISTTRECYCEIEDRKKDIMTRREYQWHYVFGKSWHWITRTQAFLLRLSLPPHGLNCSECYLASRHSKESLLLFLKSGFQPMTSLVQEQKPYCLPVKFKCLIMDSDYMTKLGEVKLEEQENVTHCYIILFSEENGIIVLVI